MRTDDPDLRFAPGASLRTEPADRGPLTVEGLRWHSGTLLLRLAGPDGVELTDREAADAVRNTLLVVEVADLPELEDPDSFYDHQLVGLAAHDVDGTVLGTIAGLVHGSAQDLLRVTTPDGREALVPFVKALVPEVDLTGGRVVIADRPGLVTPLPDEDRA